MGNKKGTKRGPYKKGLGYSFTKDGYKLIHSRYDHPLASSVGQVLEHRMVLFDSIGPGTHQCHWCGVDLDWGGVSGIIADHVDMDVTNNDRSNLVPACSSCNTNRKPLSATG